MGENTKRVYKGEEKYFSLVEFCHGQSSRNIYRNVTTVKVININFNHYWM